MTGEERPRGWVAITDGLVTALGDACEEPEVIDTFDAAGRLVASGLVNAHHHMFQNLSRAFGPVEAWLRCEPVRSHHTVVGAKAVARKGELTAGRRRDA